MGNLLTSLVNTANSLRVYTQALEVTQNNVTNASTPGYVKQSQAFEAQPFDLTVGLPGGVSAGPVQSSRDAFAERAVQQRQSDLGRSQQQASSLQGLEGLFSLSSTSGISARLSALFSSFSQLSVNPNDTVSRQAVLDNAGRLAQSFQSAASGLAAQSGAAAGQTRGVVQNINRLAGVIANINAHGRIDPRGGVDAGADANLHSALEQLSQYADFNALQQPDGSVTVYLGGQTPIVIGDRALPVQGDFSAPQTRILDGAGQDITGQISGGNLGALLNTTNTAIPSYTADLNTLAQSVADQVNTTLAGGVDRSGAAPVQDLFSFDATAGAAFTLTVNPLTPDQIAAALPDAPGGNGNALNLAALSTAKNLNGFTLSQFYGNLGARVGRDSASARDDQSTGEQLLNQAQSLRSQSSGVSLDEEATHLIAFQRAYQATAKLLTVLDNLTSTVLQILPGGTP